MALVQYHGTFFFSPVFMAPDPQSARQLALDVVRRLRGAGYEALWAGGCVRDQILGIPPKDYDVATSALPGQVRDVFGHRQTLAIGASFGVITVLGPKSSGQLDVATFRRDGGYSDGRHPDGVSFTGAEEDAQRRDFTINGLFFDPLQDLVIDYVGGQEDLRQGLVRAIGDPQKRIDEDKLRMLRGVRFAARFDFAIDPATLAAIRQQARELVIVSAERIAAEMRQILTHANRARGMQLLQTAQLLEVVLPEAMVLGPNDVWSPESQADTPWRRTLHVLHRLVNPTFAAALAALVREISACDGTIENMARRLFQRWKLSADEYEGVNKLLSEEPLVRQASRVPWPRLQRVLVAPRIDELLGYCQAAAAVLDANTAEIDFCRQRLALPAEELNPAPLIDGEDLKRSGIAPGPAYRQILESVRNAQLDKSIATKEDALALAVNLAQGSVPS
jgi:tRNA nucleotidyltransferase/poly(A) polymerase